MKIFALVVLALQMTVVAGLSLSTQNTVTPSNTVNSVPIPGCFPCDSTR